MNTFKLFLLLATILSFVTAKDNEKKNQKQQNKNKNKCGGKSCQTSKGDPHFRTLDGTMFSYHGECDLLLVKSSTFANGIGLDIHARTDIMTDWSLISNAAIKIGNDVFELQNDDTYYFNGKTNLEFPIVMAGMYNITYSEEIIKKGTLDPADAPETSVRTWVTIDLHNDDSIYITNFKEMIEVTLDVALEDTIGMLGTTGIDGMVGRDGTTVFTEPNDMGSEWQITNYDPMLFHERRSPQYPERCILPLVQSRSRKLRSSEQRILLATNACAGVNANLHTFCYDDVLFTGDASYAGAYKN